LVCFGKGNGGGSFIGKGGYHQGNYGKGKGGYSNNNSGGNRKVQDELRTISDETQLLQTECEELLKRLFDHDNNKDIGTLLDESEVQEGRKLTAQLQYWYRLKCILKEEMDI